MKKVMKRFFAAMLAIVLCFSMDVPIARAADTLTISLEVKYGQTEARQMLQMVNDFRTGSDAWVWDSSGNKVQYENLGELVYDYELEKAAMQRAAEVAISFSHTRPDGTSCFTAVTGSYSGKAENIAAGTSTAAATFALLQETDEDYAGQGHRRNMLSAGYNRVGIGHVVYNGRHYWVQEFGKSSTSTTATSANDTTAKVPITVASTRIQSKSVLPSTESVSMVVGQTANAPTIQAKLLLQDAWPSSPSTIATDYTWTIGDTSIISISNGVMRASKAGTTTMTTTVWGQQVSIPVTVTVCQHSWDAGTVTTKPTCSKQGVMTYTCTKCSVTKTEAIATTAHTIVTDKAVAATCEVDGKTAGKHCSVCGAITVAQEVVPATGHTVVTDKAVAATCDTDGKTAGKHCSVCGKITVAQTVVPATGHTVVIDAAVSPTCEKTGLTEGSHCSVCNKVLVKQTSVPALGHTNELVSREASTCAKAGVEHYECTVCGKESAVTLELLPHTVVADKAVKATCTKAGLTEGSHCSECGKVLVQQTVVPAYEHQKVKTVSKATLSKDGKVDWVCSLCGKKWEKIIYYPETVSLSTDVYAYNGAARTPKVTVVGSDGNVIADTNYKITYAAGRKNVGEYTVKITFRGNYSGTVTKTFTIQPSKTNIVSLTANSKGFTVKWGKKTEQVSGYQVQYSISPKFSSSTAKITNVTSNNIVSKTVSGLNSKQTYYVRVRAYQLVTVNGVQKKILSSWSPVQTVVTK